MQTHTQTHTCTRTDTWVYTCHWSPDPHASATAGVCTDKANNRLHVIQHTGFNEDAVQLRQNIPAPRYCDLFPLPDISGGHGNKRVKTPWDACLINNIKTVNASIPRQRHNKTWELPLWMVRICWATTDNTSRSMRLNSSKQDQAPHDAKPCTNKITQYHIHSMMVKFLQ